MFSTVLFLATMAHASSHREAPAIALDPSADLTDLYAFEDPNDSSKLVLIMNTNPFEEPGAGPNWYRFDDNVKYTLHVDNEGDGLEDVDFDFVFHTAYQAPDTFLYNVGDIGTAANLNPVQTYDVYRYDDGVASTVVTSAKVAPANVG